MARSPWFVVSLESRCQAGPVRLVFRATWSHRQLGINASSHLERHDAKFRRLLGSSLTFTHLMPVGTSFLDLLVPVPAGWGSSNRRIAASRHPGTAVRHTSSALCPRARLGLENLIPRKLGKQPCRWCHHQGPKLSSSQGHRWFMRAKVKWFQGAWPHEVRWSLHELGIKSCQVP